MVEWIIGGVIVAGVVYFGYKVAKGSSVSVSTLDVNKDGKLDKADAQAAVEKVAEAAKENVAEVADKAAAKVKKNVAKAADKTAAKVTKNVAKAADKVAKKAGRPKKTA